MSRTRGLEKQGRTGRVKERKERGKGREVNKVSCSLLVGALWPVESILKSRDITDKGLSSQSYGFSSSHECMSELSHTEG